MMGQNHILIGCAGVMAAEAFAASHGQILADPVSASVLGQHLPELPLLLLAAAIGSMLPDLDHPRSMISNFSPLMKLASFITSEVFGHRGPIHSLLVWGLLTFFATQFAAEQGYLYLAWAASLGYLLHMVGDSLTHEGVPWLWPLWRHPFGLPILRFTTGGMVEHLVTMAILVGTALLVKEYGFILV